MIMLKNGRCIGPGQAPYIVAEVGSNWRTLDDCKLSIAMAKRAGADAVKFQLFGPRDLHGMIEGEHEARQAGYGLDLRHMKGVCPFLDADWLPILKAKADDTGIDFLCTAFSPELVDAVDPHVEMHKVASAELSHLRLLERIRAKGKPVILSTGASGPEDVRTALQVLQGVPIVLMYCVAAYPARDVDFRMIQALQERFPGVPVGYSDHTTDYGVIPRMAIDQGACVLEKHFTAIEADTPDRPHSLTVDEFKKMVQTIRGERPFAWGSGEENEMRIKHNRRLIATHDIALGSALTEGVNFGIYRSLRDDTRGISAFAVAQVAGKRATRAIAAGEAIGPGDFN